MTVQLAADDGTTLELDDCEAGYLVQSVEVGAPEARDVVDPRTMSDGAVDRTAYVGARAITINLRLVRGPSRRQQLLDALAPFLHPGRRSWLTIAAADWEPRMYRVRADDWSAPWERPLDLEMALSWRTAGSNPFAVGLDENAINLAPSTGAVAGRAYNENAGPPPGRVYDRTYPAAATTVAPIVNAGSAPADFEADVYGPLTGFTIANLTTGGQLAFPTLTVPAGSYVAISSATHTVLMNSDPASSRYSYLDFAHSAWFRLAPGLNRMTVQSSSFSAPAQTVIRWRDTYMT